MTEFQNALDVLGIRPELVQHLPSERIQSLAEATGRVLARVHHPDLGGNEKFASRVNLALEDLGDEVSLKMIREEYLEDLRFSELVKSGRSKVLEEQAKRHRVGDALVEMMLSRRGQHFMEWYPCEIQLFESRHFADLIQQGADTERELDSKIQEDIGEQIDVLSAVSEQEVEAKWRDKEFLFELFGEKLLDDILDWSGSMMKQHHPELYQVAQVHRINDTLDEWLSSDPVGLEYADYELEFFEQFYEREVVRKQYLPGVRDALEKAKRRLVEFEHGDTTEKAVKALHDDVFQSVSDFKEYYRAKRQAEQGKLRIEADGTLHLSSPEGQQARLDQVKLLGALKLYEPSNGNPCPWFPLSSLLTSGSNESTAGYVDADDFGGQDDYSQALGLISPAHFLELSTKGDGRFSCSFGDVSRWIEEQEPVFRSKEESESVFLLATVRRQSGESQIVCLGEVVGITPT